MQGRGRQSAFLVRPIYRMGETTLVSLSARRSRSRKFQGRPWAGQVDGATSQGNITDAVDPLTR